MARKVSNIEVKKINRNRVFRFINEREHTSKPEIAAALGVSTPTVLQIVNELIEEGLVYEAGEYASTGGRKAAAIASSRNSRHALGLDITQNHIGLVLVDLHGGILSHERLAFPFKDEDGYYTELVAHALGFLSAHDVEGSTFLGAGISVPGIVDKVSESIAYSHALGIRNMTLDRFKQRLPFPCMFVNDANAAAIAELYHDHDRKDAVYLSLSNSVGGAVAKVSEDSYSRSFLDELVYVGDQGRAGEFGHMTLVPGGAACYCGKMGCMDAYCNAKLLARCKGNSLEDFFEALADGDRELELAWNNYLDHLAIVINNLRMAFDCRVIIGGYVGSFIEPYIEPLRKKAEMRNTFEQDGSYIEACRYKVEASALGAALLQVDSFIAGI